MNILYTGGHNYVRVIIVSFIFSLNVNVLCLVQFLKFSGNKINLKGNNLNQIFKILVATF